MQISLDRIFSKRNLDLALENILAKRDGCGIDGIRIREFEEYWNINGDAIIADIYSGSYKPNIVQEVQIINARRKRRTISKFTTTDRLILRAIEQAIEPYIEEKMYPNSFAYRDGLGVGAAVQKAADYIEAGGKWVAEIDINDFFDNIPIDRIEVMVSKLVEDESTMTLIKKYLRCRVENGGGIRTKDIGLVQGSAISPILSNYYLMSVDSFLHENGYHAVRYGDNINIYTNTDAEAADVFKAVSEKLVKCSLSINHKKSGIFEAINRRCLGYQFEQDKKTKRVIASRYKNKVENYNNWKQSNIQIIDRDYYIVNDGILTKSDYTLLFDNDNGKNYLPVNTMESLNIYSDVMFSSNFFDFANRHKLKINIFDKYGRTIGSFVSNKSNSHAKTMLKQSEKYLDSANRVMIAKKIIIAAMHNIKANLKYYYKQKHTEELDIQIRYITTVITQMNEAKTIEQLMLIEARARQTYYKTFNCILNQDDFRFINRSKRPPKDAINALISFGNVYLYNKLSTYIRMTTLDIRIGFLHSTNNRAESLNLDIAEIFKPIIVDRVIFTLINKHMINVKDYFEEVEGGGIYLNKTGKKIFLEELRGKLYQKVKMGKEYITYDAIMKKEVHKISRYVMYNEKYKPYKYIL